MQHKKAAIIIVNWNGARFLPDCLAAVLRQTYRNYEVYFVDNGSIDDSVAYVQNHYPDIHLVRLDKNYGFAKGNNKGIEAAFRDREVAYAVLLNNDTIADVNWLEELIMTVETDENIGAVGSKMIFYHDKDLVNTMGVVPLKNGNALNYKKYESNRDQMCVEKIFAPCAGAALYKRSALEKAGLFDEDYFCYLEDVDLGYRLNLCGYTSYVNPRSFVYHIHSGTAAGMDDLKSFLIVRNSLYNAIKYLHPLSIVFYPVLTLCDYFKLGTRAHEQTRREIRTLSKAVYMKNMVRAYIAVIKTFPDLLSKRKEIKKLGRRPG